MLWAEFERALERRLRLRDLTEFHEDAAENSKRFGPRWLKADDILQADLSISQLTGLLVRQRQIHVQVGVVRIDTHGAEHGALGVVPPSQTAIDIREIVQRGGKGRIQFDRPLERRLGVVISAG